LFGGPLWRTPAANWRLKLDKVTHGSRRKLKLTIQCRQSTRSPGTAIGESYATMNAAVARAAELIREGYTVEIFSAPAVAPR